MNAMPAQPQPHRAMSQTGFGRVSVGVCGRIMMPVAEGPFDAALMAATQRAIALAGKRLPADRRFGDLLEICGNLRMDDAAMTQLRAGIDAFSSRGTVAVSTVFLVPPDIPGMERLPALMDIWRASRPVRRAESFTAARALVNADLAAAGLPTQAPPPWP